jgi:hypothetical protein
MRRILIAVSSSLAVVLVGLFVVGAVLAQGPARSPDGNPPPARGWRASLAEYKAMADLLSTAPGQLLDQQLAGRTLLDIGADKGVTEQQLTDAVLAARKSSLDQAVKDGRLTQAQADQRSQQESSSNVARLITDTLASGVVPGSSVEYKAMADVLTMTPGQLLDAELAGKTLIQSGKDAGFSDQQLADAILAVRQTSLDQAVKNGRGLTQDQANAMIARMKAMAAADLVNQFSALDINGAQGGWGGGMRPGGARGGGSGGPRGNRPGSGTPAPDSTTTP